MIRKITPLMEKFMSEAKKGHFGLSQKEPLSREDLAEAKELGCYIADEKTITWGGLHTPGTYADRLNHIASKVQH